MNSQHTERDRTSIQKKEVIWKNKSFVYMWLATIMYDFTFHVYLLALPLIIYDMSQSTLAMSTMRALDFAPNIILGIFIGVIVDRTKRKNFMRYSLLMQILLLILLVILLKNATMSLWNIYIIGFLVSTFGYCFWNGFHSSLPQVVEGNQLTTANSAISLGYQINNTIGPGLAGVLLVSLSYSNGLIITIVGLNIVVGLISFSHIKENHLLRRNEKHHNLNPFWMDIKEGWLEVKQNHRLFSMTITILCLNIASGVSSAVIIFYALDKFNLTSDQLGIVIGSTAIGGILAALSAKKSREMLRRGKLIIFAICVGASGQFLLFVSFHWNILMIGMMLIGFCSVFINVHYQTLRQESTPAHLLGRVSGTTSMLMKIATPISFLSAGLLGEMIDVHWIFLMSSMIMTALMIILIKLDVLTFA
ncbi:MFS transporter [Salipaludibacillus agaradhaerens]|uniref:MFS transporter n=1 Tax=Salipaludibacillus agaradhaerens TaxID=76935 RepID=UPI002151B119|nr:MFS transporter [Salipaludibacillus agaradhaerens]MCR6106773.1 MFS transporter [Salipaludibacillus agaradhaerens]MCR6118805.1 MFS transporter [Salipaludibacillus agaradhaerens]